VRLYEHEVHESLLLSIIFLHLVRFNFQAGHAHLAVSTLRGESSTSDEKHLPKLSHPSVRFRAQVCDFKRFEKTNLFIETDPKQATLFLLFIETDVLLNKCFRFEETQMQSSDLSKL